MTRVANRYVGLARPSRLAHAVLIGPEDISFAWCRADEGMFAVAIGAAAEAVGEVRWLDGPPGRELHGPWFGGWSFDPSRNWDGFDGERWILPEVVAFGPPGDVWIAAFGAEGTPRQVLCARLDRVCETKPTEHATSPQRDPDDRSGWSQLVDEALGAIAAGDLDKLVLAREIVVRADHAFDTRAVLVNLLDLHASARVFLVRGRRGQSFVGASPETLCVVSDGRLRTEALAGTSRDDEVARLNTDKERLEHTIVVEGIRTSLAPLTRSFEQAAVPTVRAQGRLRHLQSAISAHLLPHVEPVDAARALHPTPAVAGAPAQRAVEWLAARESFARGWYAGAVGARSTHSLDLAVGIRSAWIHDRVARVFVGAGVVDGSIAAREWDETELKASVMLRALGVHS